MKRGVELSINNAVMLILTIAALSAAFLIVTGAFQKAEEVAQGLSPSLEQQLEQELRDSSVAVAPASATVNRGSEIVLGAALKASGAETFRVNATLLSAVDAQNKELKYNLSRIAISYIPSIEVAQNEMHFIPIIVTMPQDAPSGTYLLAAGFCSAECDMKTSFLTVP